MDTSYIKFIFERDANAALDSIRTQTQNWFNLKYPPTSDSLITEADVESYYNSVDPAAKEIIDAFLERQTTPGFIFV